MMNKIRSMKQLRKQKKLLRQREEELLFKINTGWKHLKENLRPHNFLKQIMQCDHRSSSANNKSKFNSIFSNGMTLLVKILIEKAEEKFSKYFM